MATVKTNAVRWLDSRKISYQLQEYEVDEHDLSAVHVAENQGLDPNLIFKTLVVQDNTNSYAVAVIPGGRILDLKKLAKVLTVKKCELIPMKDLLAVTGYVRGGCSPLGMKKLLPTFIDNTARNYDSILVSAGKRGLQLVLSADDLAKAVHASFVNLT